MQTSWSRFEDDLVPDRGRRVWPVWYIVEWETCPSMGHDHCAYTNLVYEGGGRQDPLCPTCESLFPATLSHNYAYHLGDIDGLWELGMIARGRQSLHVV